MRILIVGPFGQDARCIHAELSKTSEYELFGVTNRPLSHNLDSSNNQTGRMNLISEDLSRKSKCFELLDSIKPQVIFHLAAVHGSSTTMSGVEEASSQAMWNCHFEITKNIVDWIKLNPTTRLVFAGSSQIFLGLPTDEIISEESLPAPINEYGKSKLAAWNHIKAVRVSENLHLSCGILFNHTSEFSKPEFLFPEIATQISKVVNGKTRTIGIRHPEAFVDISSAHDIAKGMILMSKNGFGGDFVLGSGKKRTISSIVHEVIHKLDFNFSVEIEALVSRNEIDCLVSNPTKAKEILSWKITSSPENILMRMVQLNNSVF